MTGADTHSKIARWRTARKAVLASIVLAGSVVTSAAVMSSMAPDGCRDAHPMRRAYTYSGVGIVLERHDGQILVRRVMEGSPAESKLFPGARLVTVDGTAPPTLEGWATAIRGTPGSDVELEVVYPCGGHRMVTLTRDVVRVEY